MKKYLLLVLLFSFVFLGCTKNNLDAIDVNAISDLQILQKTIVRVSESINKGVTDVEKVQNLVEQLQQKYIDLTDTSDQSIEDEFIAIQTMFDKQSITSYTLPLWAKRLGMIYPKGMSLDKTISQRTTLNDSGYNSTVLVYTGDYNLALQQAEIIAQKAHLSVSKNFQQAQAIAKVGNVDYISGLDIGSLSKGIVYINHELLDTTIDNLLSVSVDQNGILTIEATRYAK